MISYSVAPSNRVAVFLAVTASAHINEPLHRGLRGSEEKSKKFSPVTTRRRHRALKPLAE
jgi:hypothetical protein